MGQIKTNEAIKIALEEFGISCTLPSMIDWIPKYDLGKKIAGRWYIDEEKLRKFLKEGS